MQEKEMNSSKPNGINRSAFKKRWLLVLLIIGLIIWLVVRHYQSAETTESERKGNPDNKPKPVAVAKVTQRDVNVFLDALGTVTSRNTVTVVPRVSGQLIRIHFKEGQLVKAGELLAEIDPRPFQVLLDQAKGQLLRDQALLDNALLDLKRYQTLQDEDSIAQQQVATQQALVKQYQGTVAINVAAVESANLQLSYCRIVAPISGRIGLRQVDAGNLLQNTATTGIATITQLQPITVLFNVPEDQLAIVNNSLKVEKQLPVEAFNRGQTLKLASGHLLTTDNEIDASTGTIKMRGEFANNEANLFPNQFVNIKLLVEVKKNALVMPVSALQRGSQGQYVYIVDQNRQAKLKLVKPGYVDGESVVIESGLKAGETVITDGLDKLKAGAEVKVITTDKTKTARPTGSTDGLPPSNAGMLSGQQRPQQNRNPTTAYKLDKAH